MTWKELLDYLCSIQNDSLDDPVRFYNRKTGEFLDVDLILDEGDYIISPDTLFLTEVNNEN